MLNKIVMLVAGLALPDECTKENVGLVEKGLDNMLHLIKVLLFEGIA